MNELFATIEQSALSVWMREALHAYFVALIFHAWGMALLIGGGIVLSLRVLGVAGAVPLQRFRSFVPVMWVGAVMGVVSGFFLLVGYPAKALTNPIFGVKLVCLVVAALVTRRMLREPAPAGIRAVAATALVLWLGVVAAGKLLLYTYSVLMVTE
jgi:predicted neutral ceramidase superfamily lipid hydrolase